MRPHLLALATLTALGLLLPAPSAALPVEASHPVAPFLRRLEEKGLIAPGFWSTLPRDAAEISGALRQAQSRDAELSAWDRRRLERYLNEFEPARKRQGTRLHHEDSLFTLHGGAEYFTGGYLRDSVPQLEGYAFGSFTPSVEGTYRDNLYFTASATLAMERNRNDRFLENYDPQRGLPHNTNRDGKNGIPQGVSTFDGFRAVIGFGDSRIALEAGQDWNQWGPGRWQHATLGTRPHFWVADSLAASTANGRVGSETGFNGTDPVSHGGYRRGYRYPGEGAPMAQIRLRVRGHRWEYTKIVAERMGLHTDSTAKLVAHRVQVRLGSWKFGGTEMLSVGTRPLNGVLLLPGIPLKFAEHSGGDRDNASMAVDAEWTLSGHGRVYGEFLLDDYSGPPMDFWGNKFAWVVGGSWQDPLGLPAELNAEYAHVDPWVFGHRGYNTALQHYGALLGSSLPPNSRAFFASAAFPLPADVEGLMEWNFRQRDLKSPGSSIFDDYARTSEETTSQFLERDVETRNAVTASADWSWRRHVQVKAGGGALWVQNWNGNPGVSLATPTAFGEVRLRY
jgi:hypothetical protein